MSEQKDERYSKLLNLHDQLKDVKGMRKSMMADYRDQIKNIEAEIADLVEKLKEIED